jgi:hypothetical protein
MIETIVKQREGRPNRLIPLKRIKCSKYIHLLAQANLVHAKNQYTDKGVLSLTNQTTKNVENFLSIYQTPATIINQLTNHFSRQKFSYQSKSRQKNSWLTIEEPTAQKLETLVKEINQQQLATNLDIPTSSLTVTSLLSAIISYQTMQ